MADEAQARLEHFDARMAELREKRQREQENSCAEAFERWHAAWPTPGDDQCAGLIAAIFAAGWRAALEHEANERTYDA